jgi:cell division protein FtsI (penicillin-binding protein 3)
MLVAALGFAVWAVAIEARLVWLQIARHDALVEWGTSQRQKEAPLDPRRGDIVDRTGRALALSVDADRVFAVLREVKAPEATAQALCDALDDCDDAEKAKFEQALRQRRGWVLLRRQIGPSESRRIRDLDLPGIVLEADSRRYYPNRELAAHILGYVGVDNKGLAGIEQTYDSRIRGREGTVLLETDARQRAFSRVERPPTAGATLELTIDAQLQYIAERELRAAVAEEDADGGTIVMMNPGTGDVLATANYPTFNPNAFGRYQNKPEVRRNRAVQEIYEPGSTFKIVTASAAIEEHAFDAADVIDVSAGAIRIGSRVIKDVHRYGPLSFVDVLVKSSNVGAIKIGDRVGAARLGDYVRRFGFGKRACGDLPGETPGMLSDSSAWSTSTLASVSMGYEIGVTPIQMAAAVSAVANGGELLQPRVVRAIRTGSQRTESARATPRRAIKAETASDLVGIMEQVVERGTAKAAAVPGYTVAGKTGTAAKIVNGLYSKQFYHASFVGFVPSRAPALTILVVIDSPRRGRIYGGAVAAPVFSRVAAAALRYLRIPPTINAPPPVLVAASPDDGAAAGLMSAIERVNAPVDDGLDVQTGPPTLPDLRGLGAREAARRLARLGLTARLSGDGVVVQQDPEPGSPIDQRSSCRLWLERTPVSPGLLER